MPRLSEPLRHTLQGAINQRNSALRNNRSGRKDYDQIRVSIGRADQFLREWPFADDQRVRDWCKSHVEDLSRIVPGNAPRTLAKLLMEELRELSNQQPTAA